MDLPTRRHPSQSSRRSHDLVPLYGTAYHDPRRPSRRSIGRRYGEVDMSRSSMVDYDYDSGYEPSRPQKTIPFEEAVEQLHESLEEGSRYYKQFLTVFEEEIRSVERYADENITTALWRAKVKDSEKRNRRKIGKGGRRSEDEQDLKQPELESPAQTFRDPMGQIVKDFRDALQAIDSKLFESRVPHRGQRFENENIVRLHKKLAGQYKEIRALFNGASENRNDAVELSKEIEMVLSYLNSHGDLWDRNSTSDDMLGNDSGAEHAKEDSSGNVEESQSGEA
ncbi:MAG: hypothetical protein M1834_008363 [Cirrosporium novae-zelandiae]|nr:MAG: hypothetical protein M1834_008363 [Cirrosporium novae-zelandiae]